MRFQNNTPFPAMGWESIDNKNNTYISCVLRVKYAFSHVNTNGEWLLKLHTDQGELFGKDMYYNEDDVVNSSVRFESDYIPYKPHADFIFNGFAHATVPLKEWRCGVKVLRMTDGNDTQTLIEKWVRVRGERFIQQDIIGASFTSSKKATKVPIRYEYANGGSIRHLQHHSDSIENNKPYLVYSPYNPVGVGVIHKSLFDKDTPLRAPQIEGMNESLDKPNMPNPPQGFGFIGRSWEPRISFAGTFDKGWEKEKHPLMPDDYKETYNNAAHPDLQLKTYFKPFDKIVLHNLVKDRHEQSFTIPNFYFKATVEGMVTSVPHFLDIDTVIVDALYDDMTKNAVYISYRTRIPSSKNVQQTNLSMFVPKDFIGGKHG